MHTPQLLIHAPPLMTVMASALRQTSAFVWSSNVVYPPISSPYSRTKLAILLSFQGRRRQSKLTRSLCAGEMQKHRSGSGTGDVASETMKAVEKSKMKSCKAFILGCVCGQST